MFKVDLHLTYKKPVNVNKRSMPVSVKFSATYGEDLLFYLLYFRCCLDVHRNLIWIQESHQGVYEM